MPALTPLYTCPLGRMTRLTRTRAAIAVNLCLLGCPFVSARVVYVNKNAAGATQDGSSWSTAFLTVQAGIDAAASGDEVWVAASAPAASAYAENITLKGGVALYGGFASSETSRTQRDWKMNVSVLDGNGAPASTVVTSQFVGVVLDGFTVRNGTTGVRVSGTMTVTNCVISGNGNGFYITSDGLTLTNSAVIGNSALGVVVEAGTARVTNCSISGSSIGIAAYGGVTNVSGCNVSGNITGFDLESATVSVATDCTLTGNNHGFFVYGGTATITNCTISGSGKVEGISAVGSTLTVANCTISQYATGISMTGNRRPATIVNCNISGNSTGIAMLDSGVWGTVIANCTVSGNASAGIHVTSNVGVGVTNCIVTFNGKGIYGYTSPVRVAMSHSDVFGNTSSNYANVTDPTGSDGNISEDPLFQNAIDGDLRLIAGSPCINAGDDSGVTSGMTDLDGKPRKFGAHVDLGAYEYGTVYYTLGDAAQTLRFAGGLSLASPADEVNLNVDSGSPSLDLRDAVRICRKVAGLEPNP